MNEPSNTIPDDIWATAKKLADELDWLDRAQDHPIGYIAAALMAERERWKPAVTYFERYCQDEAADDAVDFVGCSERQHEDARAFADAIRSIPENKNG